jgi:hypothetical protein
VQQINRDDLRVLLDAGTVVPVEALPAPHYDAEHLQVRDLDVDKLAKSLLLVRAPLPTRPPSWAR